MCVIFSDSYCVCYEVEVERERGGSIHTFFIFFPCNLLWLLIPRICILIFKLKKYYVGLNLSTPSLGPKNDIIILLGQNTEEIFYKLTSIYLKIISYYIVFFNELVIYSYN